MNKRKLSNIIFIVVIVLLIIPQTRTPIQVWLNKAIVTFVKPSKIEESAQQDLNHYDWTLRDLNGRSFDFNSVKGKIVVINFWATWCPPCIAEMPSFQRLYNQYENNENVMFLFVSNEDKEVVKKFINKKDYTFEVFQSLSEYPEVFDVTSIPRTFVIDKNGKIVIDKTGPADWNSASVVETIENLLKVF